MTRLKQICQSRGIIGKMANKNTGLTLMPFPWYDSKVTEHIKNAQIYQKIKCEPSKKIIAEMKWIIQHFKTHKDKWYEEERDKSHIYNAQAAQKTDRD